MGKLSAMGQPTRPTQRFILLGSILLIKLVTEANSRWRVERCSLRPTLLSAPSCKAGVYARCRLKTMRTGDERLLPELSVGIPAY